MISAPKSIGIPGKLRIIKYCKVHGAWSPVNSLPKNTADPYRVHIEPIGTPVNSV